MPLGSCCAREELVDISTDADVLIAQRRARLFAAGMGFGSRAQWEIAIAVSEAATNILKFGVRGTIALAEHHQSPRCFGFTAVDEGGGIEDLERAILDGVSEGRDLAGDTVCPRGLGCGLGAIKRLMDGVSFGTGARGGTILRAHKHLAGDLNLVGSR